MNPAEPVVIATSVIFLYALIPAAAVLLFIAWDGRDTFFEKYDRRIVTAGGFGCVAAIVVFTGFVIWKAHFAPPEVKFEITTDYIACPSWPQVRPVRLDDVAHLRVDHYKRTSFTRGRSGYDYHVVVAYLKPSAGALRWESRDNGHRYVMCRFEGYWGDEADVSRIHKFWQFVLQQRRLKESATEPAKEPAISIIPPDTSLVPSGRSFVISPSDKVTYE